MGLAQRYTEDKEARKWFYLPTSGSLDSPAVQSLSHANALTAAVPDGWIAPALVVLGGEGLPVNCLADDEMDELSFFSPQSPSLLVHGGLVSLYASALVEGVDVRAWFTPERFAQPSPRRQVVSTAGISIARYVENLEADLQLTKSQLAQALSVERATLYQWFRGAQPRTRTIERLEQLRQFATEWRGAGLGSARAAWHLRISGGEHTLGSLLTREVLDFDLLRAHIRHAQRAPESMELVQPKASYGFPSPDEKAERKRDREVFPPTFSRSK